LESGAIKICVRVKICLRVCAWCVRPLRQWGGPQCNILQFQAQPSPQGYGQVPQAWSWGGNVLQNKADSTFHLFVAEMEGGCPLSVC
jgi:hypothetical protein